jgi:hypothetical protein
MPTPSSNDLIVAGIADIVHALQHPTVGSTIAPLTRAMLRRYVPLQTFYIQPRHPQQRHQRKIPHQPVYNLTLLQQPLLRYH